MSICTTDSVVNKVRHIIPTLHTLLYNCAGIEEGYPKHDMIASREVCQGYHYIHAPQSPQHLAFCHKPNKSCV